jgi:GNAT superfamily N-acetyltransferase
MWHVAFIILVVLVLCVRRDAFAAYARDTTGRCTYQWDSGYVCPSSAETKTYKILPYSQHDDATKQAAVDHLSAFWTEWTYDQNFIEANWGEDDMFYIMVSKDARFLGTVAVDRKNFFPVISQMYVVPSERRRGLATELLRFGEKVVKSMGFDSYKVWCEKHLVPWYEKRGYRAEDTVDQRGKVLFVMNKPGTGPRTD